MKKICFLGSILLLLASCNYSGNESNTLTIFHAGSLSMPIKAITDSFAAENPGVLFRLEAAGSVECARKITELKREADIIASADYRIIDELLVPEYAQENILFAGNEMALVYTSKSKYSKTINADNWYDIIQQDDVHYGRSDPNADPCGYRTLLTLLLAEKHYIKKGLANAITSKDERFIRPKEVDLIALLETGAIDYIFLYRSVAVQHGLQYLSLPGEINLGNPKFADLYQTVSVKIRGSSPNDTLLIVGEPMVYGITVLNKAPNRELAKKFEEFFTSKDKGLKVIESMGMPLVWPLVINK